MNLAGKKNFYYSLAVFIILLLTGYFISVYILETYNSKDNVVPKFEKAYYKTLNKLIYIDTSIYNLKESNRAEYWDEINKIISNDDVYVFVFEYDSLNYWNTNEILPLQGEIFERKAGITKLNGGWYQFYHSFRGGKDIFLFKKILKRSPVNNKFFTDYFDSDYIISPTVILTGNQSIADVNIFSKNGDFLVGFVLKYYLPVNTKTANILSLILILAFIFTGLFITVIYTKLNISAVTKIVTSLFYFIALYSIYSVYSKHSGINHSIFFKGFDNIAFIISNRGGALLFSFYVSFWFFIIYKALSSLKLKIERIKYLILTTGVTYFILLGLILIFREFYFRTVEPGGIAMAFLIKKDFVELIFLLSIAFSVFLVLLSFVSLIHRERKNILKTYVVTFIFFVTTLVFFVFYGLPLYPTLSVLVLMLLFPAVIYFTPSKQRNLVLLRWLSTVLLISGVFTVLINRTFFEVNNNNQKNIAKALVSNFDITLNKTFKKVSFKIKNDPVLITMMKDTVKDEEVINYLMERYFKDIFNNYDIQATLCRKGYLLELQPEGNVVECSDFFESVKNKSYRANEDSTLYLIDNESENVYYLGVINLAADSLHQDKLYIEFYSSIIPSDLSYIKILQNGRKDFDISGYTLAKFRDNELVYQYGDYEYHNSIISDTSQYNTFLKKNGYIHYIIDLPGNKILVVSRPETGLNEKFSTFSLLFILFIISGVIFYVLYFGKDTLKIIKHSFGTRLQLFFISTIIFLFIAIAFVTGFNFYKIRNSVITNQLNEKTKSILQEIQYNFPEDKFVHFTGEKLNSLLKELSLIFYTDINLYSNDGYLMGTTQPEIYEKGILAPVIYPEGYKKIALEGKLVFMDTESIGELKYYSSYVPVSFGNAGIDAILNIPYLTKQGMIKKSFFLMFFNYLNFFVLIAIAGMFIAIIVSRALTKPLAMVQKSLASTGLEKKNQEIDWSQKDDEIGMLIDEYNKMLRKLEKSADLLKRSERESAWREIAQQIAHEIRNPLTPMKLNVQYLQKSFKEKDEKFDEKFKSLTRSLITQIESLNDIASMFSDLAKYTTTQKENIDLVPLIKSSVLIYKTGYNVDITFVPDVDKAIIKGREPELLRVFNNIIKNAVQAINDDDGKITITLKERDDYYEIKIKDTGKGISDDMKSKIFSPYFTTKTSGTGIGLAIVKNIINETEGEISFYSEEGKGTVFTIKFKKAL